MSRAELLVLLAEQIIARKREDRPLKVGIDGRCAAGKTMLADELGQVLRSRGFEVLRPSVDGFHHARERRYRQGEYSARGYYEDAFDYETVVSALLEPLSGTTFPTRCRQVAFDLCTNLPFDAPPISVGENTILLFEGIFIFRNQINACWDYRILVNVDAETSLARSLIRDTDVIGPAEVVQRKFDSRYEPAWQMYAEEENPEAKANVVVDNRRADSPLILKGA